MISDPFGARRRASLFGVIATVVIAAGSGILAIFAPEIDPGGARFLKLENGSYYVRLGDPAHSTLHPVLNETSARLLLGRAEDATKASASVLDGQRRGVPLGIVDAPGQIAPHPHPKLTWSAVHSAGDVTVVAGPAPAPLADGHALLARHHNRTWLVTAAGRTELPAESTELGRSIRRRLGITPDSPMWEPPSELLAAVRELPPFRPVTGTLLVTPQEFWLRRPDGLVPLTRTQYLIAADLGLAHQEVSAERIGDIREDSRVVAELPQHPVELQRPEHVWVLETGSVALGGPPPAGIAVSGTATARQYSGPAVGAIGVDTGHGVVLVTDYGRFHRVGTVAEAESLGIIAPQPAPWPVIRLLPEGSELSRAAALAPH